MSEQTPEDPVPEDGGPPPAFEGPTVDVPPPGEGDEYGTTPVPPGTEI